MTRQQRGGVNSLQSLPTLPGQSRRKRTMARKGTEKQRADYGYYHDYYNYCHYN